MMTTVFPYILFLVWTVYIVYPAIKVVNKGGVENPKNFANWLLGFIVLTILLLGWFEAFGVLDKKF